MPIDSDLNELHKEDPKSFKEKLVSMKKEHIIDYLMETLYRKNELREQQVAQMTTLILDHTEILNSKLQEKRCSLDMVQSLDKRIADSKKKNDEILQMA
mmetsp:Transcript_18386/g.28209  ORF Transcript_18386/g.28209 Transcript_18386/m.28209 type:complete len:99 (-) Transcript_18386:101-397(-)